MISEDSEFIRYALRCYDNPALIMLEDFMSDLKRFQHLNTLLSRYRNDSDDIKDRLIINHIVVIFNCFTVEKSLIMFDYKISELNKLLLNTFLVYMNISLTDCVDAKLLEFLEKSHND